MKVTYDGVTIESLEGSDDEWVAYARHGGGTGKTIEEAIKDAAKGHKYQVAKHGLKDDDDD